MDRVCKVCEVLQPLENFYVYKERWFLTCKSCGIKQRAAYRAAPENKERVRAADRRDTLRRKVRGRTPAVVAQRAAYAIGYRKRPSVRATQAALAARRRQAPAVKVKRATYAREHYKLAHVRAIRLARFQGQSQDLSDVYIRRMLAQRSQITSKDIPQSLVEVKRLQLQIQRMTKNEKRI